MLPAASLPALSPVGFLLSSPARAQQGGWQGPAVLQLAQQVGQQGVQQGQALPAAPQAAGEEAAAEPWLHEGDSSPHRCRGTPRAHPPSRTSQPCCCRSFASPGTPNTASRLRWGENCPQRCTPRVKKVISDLAAGQCWVPPRMAPHLMGDALVRAKSQGEHLLQPVGTWESCEAARKGRGRGGGGETPPYSLLQWAQHHPLPGAMPPALHLPHPGIGLQRLDTGLPAAATLTPWHKPPVCPCNGSGVGGMMEFRGHTRSRTPPLRHSGLPGPTPMYCSARQYERLWVLRAPWGRALHGVRGGWACL